eukprot:PhM_4_TR4234/c0_g2_i1/m.22972
MRWMCCHKRGSEYCEAPTTIECILEFTPQRDVVVLPTTLKSVKQWRKEKVKTSMPQQGFPVSTGNPYLVDVTAQPLREIRTVSDFISLVVEARFPRHEHARERTVYVVRTYYGLPVPPSTDLSTIEKQNRPLRISLTEAAPQQQHQQQQRVPPSTISGAVQTLDYST